MTSGTAPGGAVEADGLRWLERFTRERGRPLRVLHIGNVANNAYNNAKIQRQRGIEADVISAGYYHIMGSPEWEDADFAGDFGDPHFPDWRAVDLRGFSRPRWFAQGGAAACRRYLIAFRQGRRVVAAARWRRLETDRWLLTRRSQHADALRRLLAAAPARRARWRLRLARRAMLARRAATALGAGEPGRAVAAVGTMFRRARPEETAALQPAEPELERRWRTLFPDREPLAQPDYAGYATDLAEWRELLAEYDVVQAYATDPIVPLLAGVPYVAYEHGTLRETPFQQTATGRICALGYREAGAVLVTNLDVVPAARRLGISENRLVLLPHAVDSDRLLRFADAHAALAPARGDEVVFLSPSRHDWVDGDPSWAKGNDRAIRALASVRARGLDCRLLLVEWGRDVESTRRLVDELELADLVTWMPPLRKRALWKAYLRCHAVLDQFVVPGIGGIAFEAMALGRRVVTALDSEAAARFFGAAPPLLAAAETDEIAEAMAVVILDPLDEAGIGAAGRAWFMRYHSADRIVGLQADAYRRVLDGSPVTR